MNQSLLNRPRNDKFILIMDIPKAVKDLMDPLLQKKFNANQIQFTVFGSPVPSLEVPPVKVSYGSQSVFVSSHTRPPYPPLSLKYLVDNGYQNYWILWTWLNLFNDQENSTSSITSLGGKQPNGYLRLKNPINEYTTSFTLYGLDEYNNKIISFKYKDAFVIKLGGIDFSHQNSSQIVGSVDFAYNQMIVDLMKDINNC